MLRTAIKSELFNIECQCIRRYLCEKTTRQQQRNMRVATYRPVLFNVCNAICTVCNLVWVTLNIQELQKIHYCVYLSTGAFLVLGHLQPS